MKKSMKIISILLILLLGGLAVFFTISGIQSLNLTKTAIKIKIDDVTKTYDGTPLTGGTYSITEGQLNEGDTINVSYDNSQTNVGSSSTSGKVTITDKNGNDVTKNYDIDLSDGTLVVTKANLDIDVKNSSLTYGEEFNDQSFAIGENSSLANGDNITTTYSTTNSNNGKVSFSVTNKNGEDVSSNYNINVTDGNGQISTSNEVTVSINKKDIYIKPNTLTKVYDGKALEVLDNSFTYYNNSDTLVYGDKIVFSYVFPDGYYSQNGSPSSNCFSGTYSINENTIKITNKNNEDVTKYYNINLDNATIGIYQQEISFKFRTFTYSDEININNLEDLFLDFDSSLNLKFNNEELNNLVSYLKSLDYGTYDYEYDYDSPLFSNIDSNYLVSFNNISILKKELSISFVSNLTKEYQGGNISITSEDLIFKDNLGENYSLEENSLSVFNLSYDISNTDEDNLFIVTLNSLSLRKKYILNNSNYYKDVSNNYSLIYSDGTFELIKTNLTIKPVDVSKSYDGKVLRFSDYEIVDGQLFSGDYLVIDYSKQPSIINVEDSKETTFNIFTIHVYNASKQDVTKFYNITSNAAKLEITKAKQTLTFNNVIYTEGFKDSSTIFINQSESLIISEADFINFNSYIKTLSSGEYNIDSIISNYIDDSNYEYEFSLLNVLRKDIQVTLNEQTLTYGDTLSEDSLYAKGNPSDPTGILTYFNSEGKTITFSEIKNVGTYTFKYTLTAEDSENYNLIIDGAGTITIERKDIQVTLNEQTLTYGDTLSEDSLYAKGNPSDPTGILTYFNSEGKTITFSEIKNVGTYTFKYTLTAEDSENYNLIIDGAGTITIERKDIQVTLNEQTLTYGDTLSEDSLYAKGNPSDPTGILTYFNSEGKTITFSEIKNVGTYTFKYTLTAEDSENYNLIIDGAGTITIERKDIQVSVTDVTGLTYNGIYPGKYNYSNFNLVDNNVISSEGLIEDEYISYLSFQWSNESEKTNVSKGIFKYSIVENSIIILDYNGNNVTSNYEIAFDKFEFSIKDFKLHNLDFTLDTKTVVYDESFDYEDSSYLKTFINFNSNCLVSGNRVDYESYYLNYESSTSEVTLTSIMILDSDDYDVTFAYDDSSLYDIKGYLFITPKTIYVTLHSQSITYGDTDSLIEENLYTKGNASDPTGTITYYKNGEKLANINDITNAGIYTFTYILDDNENYNLIINGAGTITIESKEIVVTLHSQSITYGDTLNENNLYSRTDTADVTGTITYFKNGIEVNDITNAGTYTFTYILDDNENYNLIINGAGTITIESKEIVVTLHSQSITYGDTLNENNLYSRTDTADVTGTITYFKNGIEVNDITNAGTYTFTCTLDDNENYNLVLKGNGIIEVKKKTINVYLTDVVTTITDANNLDNDDLIKILDDGYSSFFDYSFVCYVNGTKYGDISDITFESGKTYTYTYICTNNNFEFNYINSLGIITVS